MLNSMVGLSLLGNYKTLCCCDAGATFLESKRTQSQQWSLSNQLHKLNIVVLTWCLLTIRNYIKQ